MNIKRLTAQFVEFIPDRLEDGVLYVSMEHAVVSHNCACGCGRETVTPLSPTDWQLYFNGKAVTLTPSIGNWSFQCRSHYLIQDGSIRWASDMSTAAINHGRSMSREAKRRQYAPNADKLTAGDQPEVFAIPKTQVVAQKSKTWRSYLVSLFK